MKHFRTTCALLLCALASSIALAQEPPKAQGQSATANCPGASGETTDDCVVRLFKDTKEASIIRGKLVFQNYCVLCHGAQGRGDGRAAKLHNPPPYNLTTSAAPREYIAQVIRKGGEAMKRGKGMPPWGEQLTDEQVADLLNFLFSIRQ